MTNKEIIKKYKYTNNKVIVDVREGRGCYAVVTGKRYAEGNVTVEVNEFEEMEEAVKNFHAVVLRRVAEVIND